jgi:hypothetical protein
MVCNRVEEDEEREGTSLDININMNTMNVQNENLECALHRVIMPFSMKIHVNDPMNLVVMPIFFITSINLWLKFLQEMQILLFIVFLETITIMKAGKFYFCLFPMDFHWPMTMPPTRGLCPCTRKIEPRIGAPYSQQSSLYCS